MAKRRKLRQHHPACFPALPTLLIPFLPHLRSNAVLPLPFRNCSSVITFAAAAVDSLSLSSAQGWGRNRTCARALMIKDIEWKWKCTCKEVKSRAEVNILVLKVCQCEEKLPIQSKISDFQNWAPSGRSRQKTKSGAPVRCRTRIKCG